MDPKLLKDGVMYKVKIQTSAFPDEGTLILYAGTIVRYDELPELDEEQIYRLFTVMSGMHGGVSVMIYVDDIRSGLKRARGSK